MLRYFKAILSGAIAFAAASIVLGQGAQKLITLESRGAAAKMLFEEISKQAGQTLAIGQSLAQEPLVLRLDKAPFETVMAKLAFAFDAEWVTEPTGKRLIAIKRPAADKTVAMLASARKMQQKALDRLKEASEFTPEYAKALADQIEDHLRKQSARTTNREYEYDQEGAKLGRKGPNTTLAYRILTQLDARELASVNSNRRVVWSTHPTAMQKALPKSVWAAVNQFQKENGYWRDAIGSRHFQSDAMRGMPSEIYQLIRRNMAYGAGPNETDVTAVPAKVLVVGSSWGNSVSQIEVKIVDSKGMYLANCQLDLYWLEQDGYPAIEQPAKNPNSIKIELDSLGLEFSKRLQTRYEVGGNIEPMSRELEEYLLHPETKEPLALVAGQALVKYAVAKKAQLITVPSDSAIYINGLDEKMGTIDGELMMFVHRLKGYGYRTEEKDGWIVSGPGPEEMVAELRGADIRADRKELGKLMRTMKKVGYLTFEDAAEYLTATVKDPNVDISYLVAMVVHLFGKDISLINNESSRKLMLIYGAMNPMQRRELHSGRQFPLRAFNPNQQELLQSFIFGRESRVQFDPQPTPTQAYDRRAADFYYNGIGGEPTERFGNGVNPQAPVSMNLATTTMLRGTGGAEGQMYQTEIPPDQYGAQLFYQSLPENSWRVGSFGQNITGFSVMNRRIMTLRVNLDNETFLILSANEVLSQSPKVDSFEKLPAEIVKQIEAGRQRAAEQYAGRQKPPPPVRR